MITLNGGFYYFVDTEYIVYRRPVLATANRGEPYPGQVRKYIDGFTLLLNHWKKVINHFIHTPLSSHTHTLWIDYLVNLLLGSSFDLASSLPLRRLRECAHRVS